MPLIPTLQNQVRDEAAPNFQQRPLQSTVGESIAQGVGDLSNVIYKLRQEEQLKADRAAFMDADRQTDTAANDIITQSQQLQGKDAIGSAPKFLDSFDKAAAATYAGLKSKRAQAAYQESVNARRSSLQRQLDNHEGQQREAYYAKSREDFKDQAHVNAVTNYQDPKAIDAEIGKITAALAQEPGMDDAQRATELGLRRAGIYAGVIDRYLANDQVGAARKYYATVKDLAGAKAAYIENRINDTAKSLEARAKSQWAESQAGRVLSAYATEGPQAGVAAMQRFEALADAGKISREQLGDVQAKVQQGLNLSRNSKQEEYADQLADLRQNLANGSTNLDDVEKVESMWKDNVLSPTERAAFIGQIEKNHIEKAGSRAAAQALQDSFKPGGLPLVPSNPDHRKALAAAFGDDVAQVPAGSPQFQQIATAYAVKTRMVPEQATGWAQAAVRSPNPQIAAQGAQFLGAVQASAPDAVSGFDADTKAFAGVVNQMIDAGTDPAEAVATARENVFNVKPPVLDARKKAYESGRDALALGSTGALNSYIDRDFDTAFTSQPAASLDLQADFNSLTEKYFLKTGNIQVARDNAWRDVRRAYGVSEVNGSKTMMLAPPEKFGMKPEEIRGDIGAFLDANPQADGSGKDDVLVIPDAQTMRSINDIVEGKPASPSYRLIGKSGDLIVGKNGVPKRYYLPDGEEFAARIRKAQADAQAVADKQVNDAREERKNLEEFTRKTYEDYPRTGGYH